MNSYVKTFLVAEKERQEEFFDINDDAKRNLDVAKFIMLTCRPASDKLPPATRSHV